MRLIITMAGRGERFRKVGYMLPKYQIMAKGKTLFEWSMRSLNNYVPYVSEAVFVVLAQDNASDFIKEICNNLGICKIRIIELDEITDGQATTALLAVESGNLDESILIYNIDTYVEPGSLKYTDLKGDGHIPCFLAEGTHWSFVRINELKDVLEVKEKERISDYCSLGAYYFKSGKMFLETYREMYQGKTKKEKYIAPLYQILLEKGYKVTMSLVDSSKVHVLGTPEELDYFLDNNDI